MHRIDHIAEQHQGQELECLVAGFGYAESLFRAVPTPSSTVYSRSRPASTTLLTKASIGQVLQAADKGWSRHNLENRLLSGQE